MKKTSWMLKTNGARRPFAINQPLNPSVSGGDIAITASTGSLTPRTRPAFKPATTEITEKPMKPRARRHKFFLSSPANGFRRVTVPHVVGVVRVLQVECDHALSTWCSRYQGNAVTTCTSWPNLASSWTILVITTPVGAVSGSKCGQRTINFKRRSSCCTSFSQLRIR